MPGRITELSETQIIADILREQRRQRTTVISQMPQPAKDTFTVAATPATTYTLNAIPYQGTGGSSLNLSLNGLELVEGVDYTVDYTTAVVTVSATLTGTPTPADVLTADYWTTGDLIAATLPGDPGHGPATYVGQNNANAVSGGPALATAPMPPGLAAGDLMLLFLNTSNADTVPTTPAGWTKLGAPAAGVLVVYSKVAGSSESTVNITLSGSQGWSTIVRAYRGTGMIVVSSTFGTAGVGTSCALPSASVSGDPTLVEAWAVFKGFSANPVSYPSGVQNQISNPNVTLGLYTGDEPLSGLSTTPSRTATASGGEDLWNSVAIEVAST